MICRRGIRLRLPIGDGGGTSAEVLYRILDQRFEDGIGIASETTSRLGIVMHSPRASALGFDG